MGTWMMVSVTGISCMVSVLFPFSGAGFKQIIHFRWERMGGISGSFFTSTDGYLFKVICI